MKKMITILTIALVVLSISLAFGQEPRIGFGFNARVISGFPTGAVFLTGGGAYNPEAVFLKTGGHFRCLENINQGPLSVSINPDDPGPCLAGQGVRWDAKDGATQLLESFDFKCTGAAGETLKHVVTSDNTVVMVADFYRQGDGNDESFNARMFVSEVDQAPDIPGIQNIWIQGVGCGEAIVHFSNSSDPANLALAAKGSTNGAAGQMPAYYEGQLFTVNMKEQPKNASASLIGKNPSINEIYASNDLDEEQDFIPVINAIQGEGFNPLWRQILIVFNAGFTPHQFTSEEGIEAAAAGPNPEITLVETDEVYRCSVVGGK